MAQTRTRQAPARAGQTRSRAAISYAEASDSEAEIDTRSSDEEGVGAERVQSTQRRITRSTQPRSPAVIVIESDTATSEVEEGRGNGVHGPTTRQVTGTSQRSKRIHRRTSSSVSSSESDGYKTAPKRRKTIIPSKTRASPFKKRAISHKPRFSPSKAPAVVFKSSGVIPPWKDLPYEVLVKILKFASYPLCDETTFQALPSLYWLLNAALVCRNFAEPAAAALLATPPLVPMTKAHKLLRLLEEDPSNHKFGYRQKIHNLHIEVSQVATYSLAGYGLLDLFEFIKSLPALKHLEFYHLKDRSPYRELDSTIKWNYPENIFRALDFVDPAADGKLGDKVHICGIESWRWSSRLAGKKYPINQLATLHMKPCFQFLRKLLFINYQVVELKEGEEDPDHERALATAVKALPKLEHLIFESCTLVNSKLLSLLPTGLKQFELINCIDVYSDDFSEFLLTHGRKLEVLVLNHNRALDLKFLPVLGQACPRLQVLRMDLTFLNIHATYKDSEPLFEELLLADQIPVWPRTLQVIELDKLRNWSKEAAETFFDSLLDSAADLPDLRRLSIQAIINIAWRDRAAFRDKWCGSLQTVFKRVSAPPSALFTIKVPPMLDAPSGRPKVEVVINEAPRPVSSRDANGQSSAVGTEITLPQRSREKKAAPDRRTVRSTTRAAVAGKYAESPSSSDTEEMETVITSDFEEERTNSDAQVKPPRISARAQARQAHFDRELEILKSTAGFDSPFEATTPAFLSTSDSSADDDPTNESPKKKKSKGKQVIQGMCDIVEVRIDNLRPTETQATEADFLDEEPSGDEDWDGHDTYFT